MRSVLDAEPVLICPVFKATAKSAMVVSSVSPLRWLITAVYPFLYARFTALIVSVSEPIWFTLTKIEFATSFSIPILKRAGLVTNKSSPTNWIF